MKTIVIEQAIGTPRVTMECERFEIEGTVLTVYGDNDVVLGVFNHCGSVYEASAATEASLSYGPMGFPNNFPPGR